MKGSHDVGGDDFGPVDRAEHELSHAERQLDAISQLLRAKGYYGTDANRRAIEGIAPDIYVRSSYYERWALATKTLIVERGLVTEDEFDRKVREIGERPNPGEAK